MMNGGLISEREWEAAFVRKKFPTGRRHCTSCGRWRLVLDFSVARRDTRTGRAFVLRSWCKPCEKNKRRELFGYEANYSGKTGRNRIYSSNSEKQKAQRERGKLSEEWVEKRRMQKRESKREIRRAQGTPPRRFSDGRNEWEVYRWDLVHNPERAKRPANRAGERPPR